MVGNGTAIVEIQCLNFCDGSDHVTWRHAAAPSLGIVHHHFYVLRLSQYFLSPWLLLHLRCSLFYQTGWQYDEILRVCRWHCTCCNRQELYRQHASYSTWWWKKMEASSGVRNTTPDSRLASQLYCMPLEECKQTQGTQGSKHTSQQS